MPSLEIIVGGHPHAEFARVRVAHHRAKRRERGAFIRVLRRQHGVVRILLRLMYLSDRAVDVAHHGPVHQQLPLVADLERIARYGAAIAARLVTASAPPDFVRVERTGQEGGQMQIRLYTGTIPDYASEVDGLLLSGVMGGGPAEKSGLRAGDIIVELAGQSIANIYDYTYALDLLKVGEPTPVVFTRDGERRETELIPEVRE